MSTSAARTTARTPCVERLETTRVLSAELSGAFVGGIPASLSPVGANHVGVRIANEGDAFVYLPGNPIQTNGIVSNYPWAAVRVVNIGNTVARGTVNLDYYLAPGVLLNANAAQAAQWKSVHIQLMPGKSMLIAARIALPYGTLPGSYTLFGVAKPNGAILVRHPEDLVAAGAQRVAVIGAVRTATLLANYRKHPRHCIYYDGGDYCADTLATYGFDDAVVDGDSVPPGFAPNFGPTSAPSSQPTTDAWNSGLEDAAAAVAAQEAASGSGNTNNPGDNWGQDPSGDGGDGSEDSGDGSDGGGDSGDGGDTGD